MEAEDEFCRNPTMSEQQTKCELCGEPMPPGEEMFNYHGYSGPCPTPAPKPPQKATCETHGHIYGHEGVCLFCRTPKPTQAPQTVCEWREDEKGIWRTRCNSVRDATTDPWEDIEAELLKNIGAPHVQVADLPPDTFVARFFAARAAVERQHAEEIAALRSTVGQQAKQIAEEPTEPTA